MLKTRLLHPDILFALGRAGHHAQVLIADGNYPFSTKLGRKATLVSLNLSPGVVNCTQVLEALAATIPIEAAVVMQPDPGTPWASQEPPIFEEFRRILHQAGSSAALQKVPVERFFSEASSDDVALTIATAEERVYANLLLTIGLVLPT